MLFGELTIICVSLHVYEPMPLWTALIPFTVTVLVYFVEPKLAPLIVNNVDAGPDVGEIELMLGAGTVNAAALLLTPPTATTTFPVSAPAGTGTLILVSLQELGVAAVPLKLTVLVLWVAPKPDPLIVIDVPHDPVEGDSEAIVGADCAYDNALMILITTVHTILCDLCT